MLKELADQIRPTLDKHDLELEGDADSYTGQYKFNWPIYLIVPPPLESRRKIPSMSTPFTFYWTS